jgi:hypothetical protein
MKSFSGRKAYQRPTKTMTAAILQIVRFRVMTLADDDISLLGWWDLVGRRSETSSTLRVLLVYF